MQGATGRQRLNAVDLGRLEISIPPLTEQQRIVAKLDKVDELCAEVSADIERRKVKVGELRQSVLEAAFKGEL
jgi:type I restriction enzyme S subunit